MLQILGDSLCKSLNLDENFHYVYVKAPNLETNLNSIFLKTR